MQRSYTDAVCLGMLMNLYPACNYLLSIKVVRDRRGSQVYYMSRSVVRLSLYGFVSLSTVAVAHFSGIIRQCRIFKIPHVATFSGKNPTFCSSPGGGGAAGISMHIDKSCGSVKKKNRIESKNNRIV